MSGRAKVKLSFDVQYFPLNGQVDVANHALRIQQALSEITLSDETVLLAKGAYSEMLDGIAHNFMDFDFLLQDREERTLMESLYTKGRIDHH